MEWRIIVPVLCLIGIIHVPGNAAQANRTTVYQFSLHFRISETFQSEYSDITNNATLDLKKKITSEVETLYKANYTNFEGFNISQFRNGSIVTDGELTFKNGYKPNETELTQILTNGNFSFRIIKDSINITDITPPPTPATTPAAPVTNQTEAPTTAASAKVAKINLVFKIVQDFKDVYSNLNHPDTKELSNNITSAFSEVYKKRFPKFHRMFIQKFSKGSIVADSVLEFDSTNGSSAPNVSDVKDTLTAAIANGNFSFKVDNTSINATDIPDTTAPVTNQTEAPTTAAPAKVAKINLVFKIVQDFKDVYANLSHPDTKELSNNITSAFSGVYKKRFPKFHRMFIQKFSKGSIVADSVLEFDSTNGSSAPNVSDVKDTLIAAIANGNFSFKVDNTSINATDIPDTTATTPAAPVTNQTEAPTTAAPAKVAKINLVFKIVQDFKDVYTNLSHPDTKELSNNITSAFSQVYKKRFPKFHRMFIQKFSKGSIVADSVLEFDSTNGSSAPNVSDVIDTLIAAIANGNFSFKVDNTSINATDIPDTTVTTAAASTSITTQVPTASNLAEYNITFKMNEDFSIDLSNMATDAAIKLAIDVSTELDRFYKGFKNFKRSLVWRFRNGSIIVDALLGFFKDSSNPTVTELARGLAEAVRNGTVKLTIDPKSINVTDSTGETANSSPVLASMLTALWMTLASLLLSAVMH